MNIELATVRLYAYMTHRAQDEGVTNRLPIDFFRESLEHGIREVFGVVVDENGQLIADKENPKFFDYYMEKMPLAFLDIDTSQTDWRNQ
ncbi:hypothetical protein [uncultured Methylophaga sp.]|uniref:hypothetical protein n=1 Tax=uncultured Methylophaga sp. TaxID=285271 RepID=UPI002617B32A|nr:hypothetical protein [uncultured Methylophaga sp.]